MILSKELRAGASNLLAGCVGVAHGDAVMLVEEEPGQNFYCQRLGDALAFELEAMGARVQRTAVPPVTGPNGLPDALTERMAGARHVIFLNRIGDYVRFLPLPGSCTKTLCYALDEEMLASPFARLSHALMSELERRLDAELGAAQTWRITCALGTDIRGTFCWPSLEGREDDDFSLSLFPVTTFKPVPCNTANGQVKLSRWLMPGGAAKVQPATAAFDAVVTAQVDGGKVVRFDGPDASVKIVRDHYDHVARSLGIARDRVHSWHAGINPKTYYSGPLDADLERWGAISFASPRYLHFHTCGDTPPGEIAWSVFNPTVWIDGEIYWNAGQFSWLQRPDNRALIEASPDAQCLFDDSADIGI